MVASFTPEELKTIADAPIFVGLAVSMVDLGIISTVPEAAALAKEVVGAAKKYPTNEIIQTVFSEAALKEGGINFEKPDIKAEDAASGALVEHAIATINAALDVLNRTATPEEITEYKGFIYTCAEAVANAAGSGLFGTGTKVSDKEAEALTRFKSVLLS
jgi:hypothetical protein